MPKRIAAFAILFILPARTRVVLSFRRFHGLTDLVENVTGSNANDLRFHPSFEYLLGR